MQRLTQQIVSVLRGHGSWVQAVAFRRDGSQLCSASGDGKVRVWNVRTGTLAATLQEKKGRLSCVGRGMESRRHELATVSF